MVSVRRVAPGFSPLDDQLALLPGHLTPTLHAWLVRLSTYLPFAQAAALLSEMAHVPLSEGTAQRLTYAAGTTVVVQQTLEADRITREAPPPRPGPDCLLLSADGAMVSLIGGEWTEVKTLVAGEVVATPQPDALPTVQTRALSSFSRLTEAETFTHLATAETHARGVERAQRVVAVSDGAEWIQKLFDLQCPRAIRILDFPHAAQRLSQIAATVWGEGSAEARSWQDAQITALKDDGPDEVLEAVAAVAAEYPQLGSVVADAAYLTKRRALMEYPAYQAQGLPIASGCVESANKLVVEARLKGAGMHWERTHVNSMVALRNVVCSDRWAAVWPQVVATRRAETWVARGERQQRRQSSPIVAAPPPPRVPLPGGKAHPPPANHPWKRKPACAGGMRHILAQRASAQE
jgi:hypothetical protein